ncbi:discoidin domain-containing protein [Streptomyces sp. NRRL S-920]|uniref:discoidin domain-containing protein n=1 Tax=Streptomyces sp. NRRL S-920 TaxID=1463921 RepID=UPI00068EFA8D|nr:discoidin domain-containing protein [Streptomyces sp. NRRL S-920]
MPEQPEQPETDEMPNSPSTTPPCPECGTPARQRGQSFCDSCGAFLRWDTPAGPANAPTAEPGPAPASPSAPAPAPRPEPEPASGGADTTVPLPAADPERADRGSSPSGTPDDAAVSDTAIRSLLVPVPEASGPVAPPETPGGVLPGRPEAARPRVRQAAVPAAPESGAACRSCGTPNAPRRHFCRSCANPLKDSAAPTAEGPYAGQRPRLDRDRTRWIARAVGVAVIAGLLIGGILGGPPAARAVQDHFAKRVPVHPTDSSASHAAPKQAAKLAFDGYSNTWWGTGYAGDSAGQWIQADFGQPTDLLNLLITPGTSARTAQAAEQARPMEFDLVVSDSAGKEHTLHRRINDGGVQKLDVRVRDAVSARLILRSAYGAGKERQVAVAELEFFGRSTGQ